MIRELKTLLAIERFGSFTAAGDRVGLTQSAVSAQMQRLESELGRALFDRNGRTAVLNAAGREAIPLAQGVLAAWARLAVGEVTGGVIRIGAISSAQLGLLPSALSLFQQKYPEWRVRVTPGVSLNFLGMLDNGDLDFAIMIKPPFDLPRDVMWRHLQEERFVLICHDKYSDVTAPESKASWLTILQTVPFIRYDRSSFGGRLVTRFLEAHQIAVNEIIEMDELQGIVELVSLGAGVAVIPAAQSLQLPKHVRVHTLGGAGPSREIGVACSGKKVPEDVQDYLLNCLVPCAINE